jgi:hypothetical protein
MHEAEGRSGGLVEPAGNLWDTGGRPSATRHGRGLVEQVGSQDWQKRGNGLMSKAKKKGRPSNRLNKIDEAIFGADGGIGCRRGARLPARCGR